MDLINSKKHILFVCTGNTCRSPMAEAIFNKIKNFSDKVSSYTCSSAGIYAYENDEASRYAVEIMEQDYGIDLKKHRAKVLAYEDIKYAGLILTMTIYHRDMLLELYPEAADKTFSIKEFAGFPISESDISDPFGKSVDAYRKCANEIETVLKKLIVKLHIEREEN